MHVMSCVFGISDILLIHSILYSQLASKPVFILAATKKKERENKTKSKNKGKRKRMRDAKDGVCPRQIPLYSNHHLDWTALNLFIEYGLFFHLVNI